MPETEEQSDLELEARVSARTEELSTLSTHLLQRTETERSTLAKELHDELGGLITAAKMDMAWLVSRLGPSLDAESRDKVDSVMQMLNQAMILKRRVVEDLRPSLLDHFGLSVALRSHFDEHCARAGIECVTTLPDEVLQLDPATLLSLFRVAQDTLTNIIARGGAKHVEVVIEPEGEGYVMVIGDDGSPMDTMLARSMPSARHRMQAAGGSVSAEARAQGNQLRVFVPRSAAGLA
ncbi:MAG TPA: histidine kinase [Steroidobacteraceae bacterium]|nr:histidine kinase [Steroidobacteraceae bacterium]